MIKYTSALVNKRCLISLVFLLCCLKLTFGFWTRMESAYANTTSEYMEIEVGSPIKLRCTLYKDFVAKCNTTSDQLIFRLRQQNLTHTIIDEYSIEYETNNATLQDNGYYQCLVPVRGYREPQLVSLAEIRVGYPPLNVTNFTCISEDFTQLNCSWNVPENAVPTTYQLYYYLVGYEWLKRLCRGHHPIIVFQTYCVITISNGPLYLPSESVLNFILHGNNSLGTSKQMFSLNSYEIVEPGPPIVNVVGVFETSIMLHLAPSKGMQCGGIQHGMVYYAKYYPTYDLQDIQVTSLKSIEPKVLLHIENLIPNTEYIFEIHGRLNVRSDKFLWGGPKVISKTTEKDVPHLAPVVIDSSFEQQIIGTNRTIILYWKPVPQRHENGDDFHYIIKYQENGFNNNFTVNAGNSTDFTFPEMDMKLEYSFEIVAANEMGLSVNKSAVISIDKAENVLESPDDFGAISYGPGLVGIHWESTDEKHTNFTVFWCVSWYYECDRPIQWASAVENTNHFLYLDTDLLPYRFGVAKHRDGKTSGLTWAPCIAFSEARFKMERLELLPSRNGGKLRWHTRCDASTRIIREYYIYYCSYPGDCTYEGAKSCKVNGNGPLNWPHISIWTTATEYDLSFLRPRTCYSLYIRARTDGGWGEDSDFAYGSI